MTKLLKHLYNIIINYDSTNTANGIKPFAIFRLPYFKDINKEPKSLIFYSEKEAENFLKKLPKDWLVGIILNKSKSGIFLIFS